MERDPATQNLVVQCLLTRWDQTGEVDHALLALKTMFRSFRPDIFHNTEAVLQLLPPLLQIAADERPATDAAARNAAIVLSNAVAGQDISNEVRHLYIEALEPHCETLLMAAVRAPTAIRPMLLAVLAAALRRRLPPAESGDAAKHVRALDPIQNKALQLPQPLRKQPALALRLVGAICVDDAAAAADFDGARYAQQLFVRFLQHDAGSPGDVALVTALLAALAARWTPELAQAFGAYGAQATNALVTAARALENGAWRRAVASDEAQAVWLLAAALAAEQPSLAPVLQQLLGPLERVDAAAVKPLRQLLHTAAALRGNATASVAGLAQLLRDQLRKPPATRRAAEAIVAGFALPAALQRALRSPAATQKSALAAALAATLPCEKDDWLVGCLHVPALRLDEAAVVAALQLRPVEWPWSTRRLLRALLDQAPTVSDWALGAIASARCPPKMQRETLRSLVAQQRRARRSLDATAAATAVATATPAARVEAVVRLLLEKPALELIEMAQAVRRTINDAAAATVGATVTKLLAVDTAPLTPALMTQVLEAMAGGVEASGGDTAARRVLGDQLRRYVASYAQRQESDSRAEVLACAVRLLGETRDDGRWTREQAKLVTAWAVANPATRETLRPLRQSLEQALSGTRRLKQQLELLEELSEPSEQYNGI